MNSTDILNTIVHNVRAVLPELEQHQFARHDRLTDLGANSVDRAEIVMLTLESLELQIPRTAVFGVNNLGELADLLHQKLLAA